MTASVPFFIDGGSLPTDAPSYVERPADRVLYERVKQGELCYLLTPRRSGKSSLLLRLRERLLHEGMKVAFVDLTMIGTNTSSDEWFYGFCRSIARELTLTEAFESWWPQHLGLPATQRMAECLRYFFLVQFAEPLLILVDEIESTRKLAFGDDFLAALRACFNARAQDPEYARLNFVLAGVSTPADLIRDSGRTPFNVGARVELTDFTMAEADGLVAGLREHCPEPKRVLERILEWTSGHPYLTQRLCKAASAHSTRPDEIDALVETELLSEQARGKEDHFKFVRERILGGARARAVLTLYRRVLGGPRVEADTRSPVHDALRLSDLVRVEANGTLVPRNRILSTVFDQVFVRRALRWSRQTLAFAASISIAVLTGIVFVYDVLPRNYLQAIDAADKDTPTLEYRELQATWGWGAIADEHFARYFDRRAMIAAQIGVRDRALLYALHADSISSKPRRRAQAAALIPEDLASLERTFWCAGGVRAVAFSPDGDRVLTGCDDNTARLWDARTGQPLGAPMQHHDSVGALAFSPDGERVLTGSFDKTARLWDAHTGQPMGAPMQNQGSVLAVAFSPNGDRILTGSDANTVRIWDARTGLLIGASMQQQGGVTAMAFSPDSERVLSGTYYRTAQIWDARTGRPLGASMQQQGGVSALAFSPDGKLVLTGTTELTAAYYSTTRIWDALTGQPLGAPMEHQNSVNAMAFSPDGKRVLIGSDDDNTARLWDARTGLPLGAPMEHQDSVNAVAFSPDGDRVLTGSADGSTRLWDLRLAPVDALYSDSVKTLALSPDGERVLTSTADNSAHLCDAHTGQLFGAPMQHQGSVFAAAFSPDGERVLTGSVDNTARLWDARTGQALGAPMKHRDAVNAVAFSPEGKRVLTGSDDKTARLWDARTGQPIGPPMEHESGVLAVAFSPEGDRVLTGSEDRSARLWDARTGQRVGAAMEHRSPVVSVAFSPDGERVLTGCQIGTTYLWDARTGQPIGGAMNQWGWIEAVAFSPDGTSAWTCTSLLTYQWMLPNLEGAPIGVVSLVGSQLRGPQSFRIDRTKSSRIQVASAIGSAALVRTVDLNEPPRDFNQPTSDLLRSFEAKFGLQFRADGEIVVPYPLPPRVKARNRDRQ